MSEFHTGIELANISDDVDVVGAHPVSLVKIPRNQRDEDGKREAEPEIRGFEEDKDDEAGRSEAGDGLIVNH